MELSILFRSVKQDMQHKVGMKSEWDQRLSTEFHTKMQLKLI